MCSGAKNSRNWDYSQEKKFENGFENLGVVATSLKCFQMVL
jgi:hypothetical protein